MNEKFVWVFKGLGRNPHPSAVFSERAHALAWINKHGLEGTLTAYPLNISAYDWAIENGSFTPSKPEHDSADFIGNFSHASQEHYHFENED